MSYVSNAARRDDATATADAGLDIQLLVSDAALRWLAVAENRQAWRKLAEDCPWSTVFQTPEFFEIWHRHYGSLWSPVLVVGYRGPTLAAVMPLATRNSLVTGTGAHQADYHGWVGLESDADDFIAGALGAIMRSMPGKSVRLRYLPPDLPVEILFRLRERNKRVMLRHQRSDEFALDRKAIESSLKKKGNASKLNRLKRAGALDIRSLAGDDLLVHWRQVTAWYDFRQGAINGVCPFLDDPKKSAFHVDWLRSAPQLLHATLLMVDDEPCSALLLAKSKHEAHLAISAHAPALARNSPMKFHLYQVGLALADAGLRAIDLTPGGDAWKARFSTRKRDVWELVAHSTLADAARASFARTTQQTARQVMTALGLSPRNLRTAWRTVNKMSRRSAGSRGDETLYRLERNSFRRLASPLEVRGNDLEFLTRHGAELAGVSRQAFLRMALERIESGERCYTVTGNGDPTCLAWLSPSTKRLYDIRSSRLTRQAASLSALVATVLAEKDIGDKLWMSATVDKQLARDLERIGFAPVH